MNHEDALPVNRETFYHEVMEGIRCQQLDNDHPTLTHVMQKNYASVLALFPTIWSLAIGDTDILTPINCVDLHLVVNWKDGEAMRLTLCHYFDEGGKRHPDPKMEIGLNHSTSTAIALTFQKNLHECQFVRHDEDCWQLNGFLDYWLTLCLHSKTANHLG